jgi:hypothetical protein
MPACRYLPATLRFFASAVFHAITILPPIAAIFITIAIDALLPLPLRQLSYSIVFIFG